MPDTSHPIPARGETTPTCEYDAPCLTGSCTESLPCLTEWHSAPAASLPVEPAGTPLATHCEKCGRPSESITEQQAGICYDCAPAAYRALTSEVSALREAVDAYLAANQDASVTPNASLPPCDKRIGAYWDALALLTRAARRDGAP